MISPLQVAGLLRAAPVVLSTAGQMLKGRAFLSQLSGNPSSEALRSAASDQPNSTSVDQFEENFERQLTAFADLVRKQLDESGLSAEVPLEIHARPDGRIVVGGSGEAQHTVESLIASDPEIVDWFNSLVAEHQLLSAARRQIAFAEQYARGRVNHHSHGRNPVRESFQIRIERDSVDVI